MYFYMIVGHRISMPFLVISSSIMPNCILREVKKIYKRTVYTIHIHSLFDDNEISFSIRNIYTIHIYIEPCCKWIYLYSFLKSLNVNTSFVIVADVKWVMLMMMMIEKQNKNVIIKWYNDRVCEIPAKMKKINK